MSLLFDKVNGIVSVSTHSYTTLVFYLIVYMVKAIFNLIYYTYATSINTYDDVTLLLYILIGMMVRHGTIYVDKPLPSYIH